MLKVFIDDSKTDGKVLVLAGFISTLGRWIRFCEEWQRQLRRPPQWLSFKARDLWKLDPDGSQVAAYYEIIKRHVISDVCVSVDIPTLLKVVNETNAPGIYRNPYYTAFHAMIAGCVKGCRSIGLMGPLEFIFDDQTKKKSSIEIMVKSSRWCAISVAQLHKWSTQI